jgi:predicted  nucleic acid-binding Zn-ribbon protein
MDWSGWKTALGLWLTTPELMAGTILLVLAVSSFAARLAWKYRDHTATQREANLINTAVQREANLKDSIASLELRLRECREDLRDAKGELRETVRQAKEDQQRITKEVVELRRENDDLRFRIKQLEVTAEQLPRTVQEVEWVKIVRYLADRSDTINRHLNALSTANTNLEGTLSDISKKLELTEPSDNGKRSKP